MFLRNLISKILSFSEILTPSTHRLPDKNAGTNQNAKIDDEKEHLSKVARSYTEGFSVHGLIKVFLSHPVEKIIWFVLLVSCLVFVGHETYNFYEEYKRYDSRTEIRMTTEENITLPAITICNHFNKMQIIEN